MTWLAALLAVCAATILILRSRRHRVHMADLGSVSEGWLAERRANDRQYSGR